VIKKLFQRDRYPAKAEAVVRNNPANMPV